MTLSSRQEARLLTADETELVGRSHHPRIQDVATRDLDDLIHRLRERRDRARGIAHRQRREMRGRAAPAGARPAADDTGSRRKAALLASAVKRASKERERRRTAEARGSLVSQARRALALRREAGDPASGRPGSRTAHDGMNPVPNEREAPSGALRQEGQEIAMRRGGGPR
ncbi:hypothetical protein SAMN02799631_00570 [Methylobacterium sp. 174MFSha1.1]|uniref:hypothetical protein n=1 Tax=Methylobacterium sp. 174MFSha1.1 TaxID=1502749 RepID=UPI0008E62706|nr:hypothetical protein [Methylobacterium sp. 174MFSha1.1]SFU41683.1 hypothetical protein SAMN02799631_00570 [Methylobacterium sp. 174MFSha1.1]